MKHGLATSTDSPRSKPGAEFTATDRGATGLVGDDIRALRKHRDLTLTALAEALGRSVGWLSQVERNQTDPSIQDLRKIARNFDIPISFFFRNSEAPEQERGVIVRCSNRVALGSSESGLVEELLSPDISGEFEMLRSVFAPSAESEDKPARPAQEGGFVVSGQLEIWIGGRHHTLNAGDSFQFQNKTCCWRNSGDVPAIVIWIISPAIY
uniref:helix-turn-helix domain-containing protein n=1 Tax=Pararhizobium sp. IMCC3301 TaxID=3067904 RepID=UPI0027422479|nr:XRE family transcriptional regulator [Pararhizobium sp. IMCC3301]